ncbi:MAG: hypothetical protein J6S14_13635 [Clostridia bacterium]|nr:hypothetical protein [Clostridia bacterium]
MSKVYIKINSQNLITAVNSSAFLTDITDWIFIDEGEGDRYTHAQSNYFPLPIVTDGGALRYKYLGDRKCVERTEEEIAVDEQCEQQAQPTDKERIEALEAAMLEMITGGLT